MFKNLLTLVLVACASCFSFAQVTILDFEAPETSSLFQHFGSTLQDQLNEVVANPAPDAVNGSDSVAIHVKPADSEVWAGAFSTGITIPIDVSTMAEVCLKVHMPSVSSVSLKLEGSSNGGPNWILTSPNTMSGVWEEVCFDVTQPSFEDPFMPAFGNVYTVATLFFEFGTNFTEDQTYYFDDLVVKQGNAASEGDVTFSVDMNEFGGSPAEVSVFGSFNNWDPSVNPLTNDGNGIWSATVENVPTGGIEYLFFVDGTAESFNSTASCTVTDPTGEFTNRFATITGDVALDEVCFNSCFDCGEAVTLTINVGTSNITVDPNGIYIAGGGNFGNPGDFPFSDDDGDGVWSITLEQPVGFESFYTFTNGACPDYSCKEDISGQDCANPDNFNDRWMGPLTEDTEINTCFAFCSDNTSCDGAGAPGNVTFQLDMNDYPGTFTTAYIFGTFNGFDPAANPLDDSDGDGIWEITLELNAGAVEYKFLADDVQEEFMQGDPCTITDPSGIFTNRLIEVEGDETVCFPWNSCNDCLVGTNDLTIEENLFQVSPTLTNDFATISFNEEFVGEKSVRVFNMMGQLVTGTNLATTTVQHQIDATTFANGLYLVHVQVGDLIATKKIMKF